MCLVGISLNQGKFYFKISKLFECLCLGETLNESVNKFITKGEEMIGRREWKFFFF